MRVLHVVTRSHRRGAEVVALELAEALDVLGNHDEVYATALAADGKADAQLPVLVHTTRLDPISLARAALTVRRRAKRESFDIVMAHGGWAAMVVAIGVPRRSAVLVWQRILGLPVDRWGRAQRLWWRAVSARFDAIVALTSDLEREVRAIGYRGPVWVIPNARNPDRFVGVDRVALAAQLRAEIGVSADVPLIGFVGHLVDQKHPEAAVDALAGVHARDLPAHLVIAGDGPLRASVERHIARLGLESSVTLLGHRDDPQTVYGGVDVTLITSRAEGIPGVAIEAQMTGCPVVTYPVGSVGDVVEGGVTGIVVARSDTAVLAEAVASLLRDAPRRHAMGAAAAERASHLTMDSVAKDYAAHFADSLGARRSSR